MKLSSLKVSRYRSLREETVHLTDLNLFIGTNASGKSSILDSLRFLHEGVLERDFREAVHSRGGIIHIAWKGEEARQTGLTVRIEGDGKEYEWTVRLNKDGYGFSTEEDFYELRPPNPPGHMLSAHQGTGWWWSGERGERVPLKQDPTACALAAAAADASFPPRAVAEFASRWGFFDPSPFLLRRNWSGLDSSSFDPFGRNLAERLSALQKASPGTFERIVAATQQVLGLPTKIELRESEDRFYFVQHELGLHYPVHQMGASAGTLRILALMTALFGEAGSNLIGIEEPENHVHPTALRAFAEVLSSVRARVQLLVTTHSPLLLDFLDDPGAVSVVRHDQQDGTRVLCESQPASVRQGFEASGFGLGEFYETKGFGG